MKLVKCFREIQMKQHLPFVKNVALDFVQLFAKKTTRFEAETALLSSSGKKKKKKSRGFGAYSLPFCQYHYIQYISISCARHTVYL